MKRGVLTADKLEMLRKVLPPGDVPQVTKAQLAAIMGVSYRTVCEWQSRGHDSRIDYFCCGSVILYTPNDVRRFFLKYTVPALKSSVADTSAAVPRLHEEQFELLCQRMDRCMERLFQAYAANTETPYVETLAAD